MTKLTREEKTIIQEEIQNLKLLGSIISGEKQKNYHRNLLEQIYQLRESISDANSDDIPSIVEQIERLTNILNQPIVEEGKTINKDNPYFGHMRLKEGKVVRDFYIGSHVFIAKDDSIKILDWKTSPISIVFYCYEEDEEYEEEIGGRFVEGTVLIKRSLLIRNGEIMRIIDHKRTLIRKDKNTWEKIVYTPLQLFGGTGSAARAETLRKGNPNLAAEQTNDIRKNKYLPEIAALIDKKQFNLITKPESGFVAIQGVAGSGKTTIGLHRIAWLHYQNKERFPAEKIIVIVFSKALGKYISKVLPSLGVKNVNVEIFEEMAAILRSRLMGNLPVLYAENTPVAAIRIKKHPAMQQIIDDFIQEKETAFRQKLDKMLDKKKNFKFPLQQFEAMPFVERLYYMAAWVQGKKELGGEKFAGGSEISVILLRLIEETVDLEKTKNETVTQVWEELFSDFNYMQQKFKQLAPEIAKETVIDAINWFKSQYIARTEQKKQFENDSDFNEEDAMIDHEDDPILLLLYQKLIGTIRSKNKVPIRYNHMMIDEAQDLSPLELRVLLNLATDPKSVTLAGDVNQKLIQQNGFEDWDQVFQLLDIKGEKVSTLEVTYRSTHEIMEFALHVLGDLAHGLKVSTTKNGPPVSLFQFGTRGELIHRLAQNLTMLEKQEPDANIALICATPESAYEYFILLEKLEIPKLRYVGDQDFSFSSGIDITDIKQVKGLEFDYVILLDADTENYMADKASRYLLHIGATRAIHQLWLMNFRKPSVLLPTWLIEDAQGLQR